MRRREFISLIGGAAAAWPLAIHAQQTPLPVIGWLSSGSRETDDVSRLPPFRLGLNETGLPRGATLRSNIAGQMIKSSDCRHSPPI
jgi:putative ABC transport system substrate-binding protein